MPVGVGEEYSMGREAETISTVNPTTTYTLFP